MGSLKSTWPQSTRISVRLFQSCMQCGACTGVCPVGEIASYSPRQIIRNIALDRASNVSVDQAAWSCATCNSCVEQCPRSNRHPGSAQIRPPSSRGRRDSCQDILINRLKSLKENGNPWGANRGNRWIGPRVQTCRPIPGTMSTACSHAAPRPMTQAPTKAAKRQGSLSCACSIMPCLLRNPWNKGELLRRHGG